jgi:hypothetical protein
MHNVQNCDSYIYIPSLQTYRSYLQTVPAYIVTVVAPVQEIIGTISCFKILSIEYQNFVKTYPCGNHVPEQYWFQGKISYDDDDNDDDDEREQ